MRNTSDVIGRATMCCAEEETTALRTLADALGNQGKARPVLQFERLDPVLSGMLGEEAFGATTREEDEFFRTLGLLPPQLGGGSGVGGELFAEEGMGFGGRGEGMGEW